MGGLPPPIPMVTEPKSILIVGCGYVGRVAARLFHASGWQVTGVTRSGRPLEEPFPLVACDITEPEQVAKLPRTDAVIDCVSSSHGDAADYERVYFQGAKNLLEILKPSSFVFTSSTSVYSQSDEVLVDENSPVVPDRETSRILRRTEVLVLAHGGTVARLSGIYGPGRSLYLRMFLEGTAVIEGDGGRFLNQIHRDDAASALFFMVTRSLSAGVYNVSDDNPIRQRDLYQGLAEYFQKPLPPTGPINPNRKRAWTSKRVSNALLRSTGWQCQYPSLLDAVAAGLQP